MYNIRWYVLKMNIFKSGKHLSIVLKFYLKIAKLQKFRMLWIQLVLKLCNKIAVG